MESSIIKSFIAVGAAYFLGSISWAYVIGRLAYGIDMTEVGNGRIGTAFAIWRLGWGWGIVVGVMDLLKGVAAVALALVLEVPIIVALLSGLAAVAGHNWSVFLGFRGGRGAATSFGVLAVLAPLAVLLATAVMAAPFLMTRRSPFLDGIRRTTLLFGLFLLVVSLILWLDIALVFMPAVPWWPGVSPLMAALPLCLLILNLAGRPEARRV